jgi:hypothetical protein
MDAYKDLARALWATAREIEKKGDAISLAGVTDENERQRLMNRASMFYGQSIGLERAAWMALAVGGEPVDADFFKPT